MKCELDWVSWGEGCMEEEAPCRSESNKGNTEPKGQEEALVETT